MLRVGRDVLMLQAQQHHAIEGIETGLYLVLLLIGTTVAQFHDKREHLVVLCVVERELGRLKQLTVKLDEHLHRHPINLQMTLLTATFLVHHPNQVAIPVDCLFFLFVAIVEAFYPLALDTRQRAVESPDSILDLPHIQQIFGNILFS